MSGFRKCCDCRESHLSCDYGKCWQTNLRYVRLTSCYQNTLCQTNSSWVFILGDFLLESLLCAQRLWILNLFSADTELWASRFDWLKDYNFWTFQMLFISSQNPVTSARELYRLLPAIMLSLFRGTQREYSSKPLKHSIVKVFKYLKGRYRHIFIP